MNDPESRVVVQDVRSRGFMASRVERGRNTFDVLIATPWGTERLEQLERWAIHPARANRQTPVPEEEMVPNVAKFGG